MGLIPSSNSSVGKLTVERLLSEEQGDAKLAHETLSRLSPEGLTSLTASDAEGLLKHPKEDRQWFGITLVAALVERGVSVDSGVWTLAIDSPHDLVRQIGAEFIAQLGTDELAKNIDLISACCRSQHVELRQGIRSSISLLAESHQKLSEELILELYPLLLREEEHEGIHADTVAILRESPHLQIIPTEYIPPILESEHAAAQELGYLLIKKQEALNSYSFYQLVSWANHQHGELREYIIKHFSSNEALLLSNLDELSPLVETDWQEVREYSFGFLRERVPEGHWNVDSLIKLCDSVKPEVQDFGKEMITRRFREEDGELYLTSLSQHPTKEMQFFVTHFLEQHAGGKPEIILRLRYFFQTAFGVVNSGRLTKARSQQFLLVEALKSKDVAEMAQGLFHHFSATCAIRDKAFYISSLSSIEKSWPDLTPILARTNLQQWKAS